jgi:hypothetical protein
MDGLLQFKTLAQCAGLINMFVFINRHSQFPYYKKNCIRDPGAAIACTVKASGPHVLSA